MTVNDCYLFLTLQVNKHITNVQNSYKENIAVNLFTDRGIICLKFNIMIP